jgi:hypothetical protein
MLCKWEGMYSITALLGCGDQYGLEVFRIPHYLDKRLTDTDEVVSLVHRTLSTPKNKFLTLSLVIVSVRGQETQGPTAASIV